MLRGILAARGVADRKVWLAGAPYGRNAAAVRDTFDAFALWDGQVKLLEGAPGDPAAMAPIGQLAVLSLDGGTLPGMSRVLDALYAKVAVGGYVVVDGCARTDCREAVQAFHAQRGIADAVGDSDGDSIHWRKTV